MSNTIGKNISLTLFGESHGEAIGAVLDGMPCGIEVSDSYIAAALARRRPAGSGETARVEPDAFRIVSGVFNGYTTGEPICILIENTNKRSGDYEDTHTLARPSHADYVAHVAHKGFEDWRGGGHFSGRLTAPIVALGAICTKALERTGIKIGTHILHCGGVSDFPFNSTDFTVLDRQIDQVNGRAFPVLDDIEGEMREAIDAVRRDCDSIGGIIQTAVSHLPAGVGEPWFGSLDGTLANAMMSIGGIKAVEFGLGFGFAGATGSSCNDEFYNDGGAIRTRTNNNGGINGGYSNGMPVVFNCAVKPTPSIAREQRTVDMYTGRDATICIKGRHDPAIIRRICPVVNALTAIVICDSLKTAFSNKIFEK
ncbi:MAG: chorismate synthase [Bacteroidales bacterium]|nr:chorismate synthase [Bacteroidales bacterium]